MQPSQHFRYFNYGNLFKADAPLNIGRIGWWIALPNSCGGRIFDICPGNNNMTMQTATTPPWVDSLIRPGGFGNVRFDGTNYADSPANTLFDFSTGDWTIAQWVRTTVGTGQSFNHTTGVGTAGYEFLFGEGGSTGTMCLRVRTSGANTLAKSTATYHDGNWHRFVGYRRGTSIALYVDGVLSASNTVGAGDSYSNPSALLSIAGRASTVQFDGGDIDDSSVWNRGLSEGEIIYDYYAGLEGYNNEINRIPRRVPRAAPAGGGGATAAAVFDRSRVLDGMTFSGGSIIA